MPTYKLNSRLRVLCRRCGAHRILGAALDRKPISNLRLALIAQARATPPNGRFHVLFIKSRRTHENILDIMAELSHFHYPAELGCVYGFVYIHIYALHNPYIYILYIILKNKNFKMKFLLIEFESHKECYIFNR